MKESPQQQGPPHIKDADNDQEEPVHLYTNAIVQLLKILLNETETRNQNVELLKKIIQKLKDINLKSLASDIEKIFVLKDSTVQIHIIGRQVCHSQLPYYIKGNSTRT